MLQEVGRIPDHVTRAYASATGTASDYDGRPLSFNTALLVKGTIDGDLELSSPVEWVARELQFFRGNFVSMRVTLSGGARFGVISVYIPAFPIDKSRLAGIDTKGIQLEHNRKVWVTEILWASLKAMNIRNTDRLIVGGDFNSSETFDTMWGKKPRGNLEIIQRMNALGLYDSLRSHQGQLTPTFRSRTGSPIHQIDHMYMTTALLKQLTQCEVGSAVRVFGVKPTLSDHLPIVADFDLGKSSPEM